jgi:hypothetical protein
MSRLKNLNYQLFKSIKKENQKEENIKYENYLKTYVVIDAARIKKLTNELVALTDIAYENLFTIEDAERLEEVAPYLIELKEEHDFTQWVYDNVYGGLGAIFLHSNKEIKTIAELLRTYITDTIEVEHPKKPNELMKSKIYVRLYDPRVFFYFMHNLENKASFFQDILTVYVENKDDAQFLECVTITNKSSINLEEEV